MLHSVPRYSNPSGTYDNDQYLLEIIGDEATTQLLEDAVINLERGCGSDCGIVEDYTAISECEFELPVV